MAYSFTPKGVCSQQIDIELKDDTIESVQFYGGCNGNLEAISRLVKGKSVDEVYDLLNGLHCGRKSTSCGDQLTHALREAQAAQ